MKCLSLAAALVLSGCVTAQVALPPQEVADLKRSLQGQQRFLRTSMHVVPFYGDATRRLLTPAEPSHLQLLNDAKGEPINPGEVEATYGAGTPVRILKVDLPGAWELMTERLLYTPRTLVWIYVAVSGRPANAPPAVLVLPPGLSTRDDFTTELERHLSRDDQTARLDSFSDAVRDAVTKKEVLIDMPAEAVEMAWGYPEKKRIELNDGRRKETWSWGNGKRTAVLLDARVQEFSPAP